MRLIRRFNKRDTPYVVADEVFVLTDGAGERYLDHDNVNEKTIEIFTEPQRQGNQVLNYTMEKRDGAEWKIWLKVFAQKEQVYLSYESLGDTVEADDINELQQAAVDIDAELQAEKRAAQAHREDRYNPHMVTREQLGLGQVENTSDADKPVSTAQLTAINASRSEATANLQEHAGRVNNPHQVTKSQVGLGNVDNTSDASKPVSTAQALEIKAVQEDVTTHKARVDNPHSVTKVQVGLGLVDNVKQASKAEFDSHNVDFARHLTAAERTSWNTVTTKVDAVPGKGLSTNDYTAAEKTKLGSIAAGAEINVQADWSVSDAASDAYIKNKPATFPPSAHSHTKSEITDMPTKLSQFSNDTLYITAADVDTSQNHVHANKSLLDKITQALLDNWNAAHVHISDAMKHITAAERTKLSGIADGANNYTHPSTHPASMVTGLASVAVSGNYEDLANKPTTPGTAPPSGAAGGSLSGTYPNPLVKDNSHAHTIANVTSLQTVLDGKAATAHTHGYLPTGGITWNQLKGV